MATWHQLQAEGVVVDGGGRRLRVTADSPAWAAQLRYQTRRILTALDQLRPGTVRAIDVRVGPAPVVQHDQDPDDRPVRRNDRAAAQRARPLLADHTACQELRRQLREQALARQAALDEATAQREAILARHYNRLRELEATHQHAIEETACASATTADERDRQQRERHRASLAVARAVRAGAIPLRTARPAPPRTGAA